MLTIDTKLSGEMCSLKPYFAEVLKRLSRCPLGGFELVAEKHV